MMRVAHNCERAEFARLRREDSKKMKHMREEILRLKIQLNDHHHHHHHATQTTVQTTSRTRERVEEVE
jgi:hypothetical protein